MNTKATITSKGQVTIPKAVRARLGLEQGDVVEFVTLEGLTYLKPVRSGDNPFAAYAGALPAFETRDEIGTWVRDLREDD